MEDLFDLQEAAKYCGLSRGALYMHYYRGHLQRENLPAHKVYFTRRALEQFKATYVYGYTSIF
jgi:hypothetical protein